MLQEWEEFTGYIIDAGMSVNDASSVDAIEEYVQSPVTDVSRHDRRIEKIEYFQQIDQLIAWESGDAHFRVYNGKTGALQHVVPGHYKELLSSDIVLDRYIVTSGNDRFLRFWDPLQEYRAVSAFMCTEAQLVVRSMPMEWSIEASVLERNERPSRTTKFTGFLLVFVFQSLAAFLYHSTFLLVRSQGRGVGFAIFTKPECTLLCIAGWHCRHVGSHHRTSQALADRPRTRRLFADVQ
jgi:hypothetical protein